ncbi:unnamed protein product [Chondrus crispus]|uniref:Uncharacterized protein n=1 Tax=Chondrus crispus TaxID=2769 RepID=R7QDJ1_CHOCR|nr:unnamed protein product [Chondrus crispus]CDF36582.1 unnamed protein product [Chondrus crispus]|eukprot:XP_005716401.1 unnamed protein product [Chondrus crispus]
MPHKAWFCLPVLSTRPTRRACSCRPRTPHRCNTAPRAPSSPRPRQSGRTVSSTRSRKSYASLRRRPGKPPWFGLGKSAESAGLENLSVTTAARSLRMHAPGKGTDQGRR